MENINPIPKYLLEHAETVAAKLTFSPKLQALYKNCFLNAYETTLVKQEDGTVFLYTGDIHAMWNRDGVQQITPYLSMAGENAEVRGLIAGALRCMFRLICKDPYANSFNIAPVGHHYAGIDMPPAGPWVWEQKYEIDTLCFPLRLAYQYWKKTEDASVFDNDFVQTVRLIVEQLILEQHHDERSSYRHRRKDCPWQDTLQNDGKGYPTKYTGMTWQGFRPSDDAVKFGYSIPGNMLAAVVLGYLQELDAALELFDRAFLEKLGRLKLEIEHGIEDFGIVVHPKYGRIYAYETDGFGNHVLADDANVPNLLSAPYLGFCSPEDPVYQNTRRFVLSEDNPYYASGTAAKGLGSPHTPRGYVWHMGLCMQGMTASSEKEVRQVLEMLIASDADTGYMHEGFNANDPGEFTRSWFAASNSMFAEFVETALEKGML